MIFLCLGDSLTAGYPGHDPSPDGISPGYGIIESQYQFWLKKYCIEFLEKNLGHIDDYIDKDLKFINKGIPGELTSELLHRIEYEIENVQIKPNYSIIIEGTNDLGWNESIEAIFSNLRILHEISRKKGIISVGATIPPVRAENSYPSYKSNKKLLNEKLVNFFGEKEISHVDLYRGMMDEKGDLKEDFAYLDGLHFSVQGYKKMGGLIFEDVIKDLLMNQYF